MDLNRQYKFSIGDTVKYEAIEQYFINVVGKGFITNRTFLNNFYSTSLNTFYFIRGVK